MSFFVRARGYPGQRCELLAAEFMYRGNPVPRINNILRILIGLRLVYRAMRN